MKTHIYRDNEAPRWLKEYTNYAGDNGTYGYYGEYPYTVFMSFGTSKTLSDEEAARLDELFKIIVEDKQ